MPDSRRRRFLHASGVALLSALAGCGGTLFEDEMPPSTAEPAPGTETPPGTDAPTQGPASTDGGANLRVVHAVPNAPNIDIVVFGDAALKDETFRQISQYLYLGAERTDISLVATGNPDRVFFEDAIDFEVGSYTGVVLGELGENTDRSVEFRLFDEDLSLPERGSARLQFVNAAPDSNALRVVRDDGEETLFDGVGYARTATATLPAGTHRLAVQRADGGDTVTTTEVTLDDRGVYTAFGTGYLAPGDAPTNAPFEVTLAEDGD
ncbi:DUF4397 domain-containing protein [Haloprofundus sp. MHR1]|uniref:DUF4397 domain-containing protein n=1 Tax=Haloprofundus sp. MHR1 TaxID=2572921 RepID=UPI0010BE8EEB|nr:DUF4397 domain-containing protein [Haloprofundus sp. MHR1]QCJ48064.1 DUF4397 domain-containing protein [Haloprofundus sp. MHR1]